MPFLLLGLAFFLPLLGGCQKNKLGDQTDIQSVDFTTLDHLNECSISIIDTENTDRYLVINSQEELDQYIVFNHKDNGPCIQLIEELDIDFSKWTLLVGRKRISHIEGELIKQDVFNLDNNITYEVTIKNGGYTAIGQFRFGVVIPKISKNTNVNFDITVE